MAKGTLAPETIHGTLKRFILADGLPFVLDLEKSHDSYLVDARSGEEYLDFFMCFASWAIGWNHPGLFDAAFQEELLAAGRHNPSNADLYTEPYVRFVEGFATRAVPEAFRKHLFFISGGALAVENAMKAAMDWKVRKNLARGIEGKGTQILHFDMAFHGRSGYTLSVTNTHDPRKTQYFAKFGWPRISAPPIVHPITDASTRDLELREERCVAAVERAFDERPDEIAAILIEPIQCEGGDRHFRPEFLKELRRIADHREALLIFDEVQTGFYGTGTAWLFEQLDVEPDVVAFGKKAQACGIFASARLDEVERNVFVESSRINSTWGGSLVDMVRSRRILDVILEEQLGPKAACMGEGMKNALQELSEKFPQLVSGVRGRGTLIAFDLPNTETRENVLKKLLGRRVLALRCGSRSLRFRPALTFGQREIDLLVERLAASLAEA